MPEKHSVEVRILIFVSFIVVFTFGSNFKGIATVYAIFSIKNHAIIDGS